MAATPPPVADSDWVTVEEFYCLVVDGQKADLIEGVFTWRRPIHAAAIGWAA
jgi:hypothetical protein